MNHKTRKRLTKLFALSLEEWPEEDLMSRDSCVDFLRFLRDQHVRDPNGIVLGSTGNLRANWRNALNIFSIEFCGDGVLSIVHKLDGKRGQTMVLAHSFDRVARNQGWLPMLSPVTDEEE
jgi:hypothetical protein